MNFELVCSGQLKYCPSVVDVIDQSLDCYIVGCYQLIGEGEDSGLSDDQLANINQRLGCLVYIDSSVIKFNFDCPDGGVFDLKVIKDSTGSGCGQCWTAHSNGTVACYGLINETIVLNQRIITGSLMLCSLIVCDSNSGLVIVGDSDSKVIAVQKDKIIADCKITSSSGDPVWCLNCIQCDSNSFVIFSGSEDSQLRINLLQSGSFSPILKTIKDFTAGVTSIAIINNPNSEHDDGENHNHNYDYIVYIGSYDETIRVYRLIISMDGKGENLIDQQSISLICLQSIGINNSGIWKLIPIKSQQNWPYILTASMYAGAHIVQEKSIVTSITIPNQLDDKSSSDHLIYGVAGTVNCNQIIVTSFYEKTYHIFRRSF